MHKLDTLFPIAFSHSMMQSVWRCEMSFFRQHCQRLTTGHARSSDLIAGGHFAKACEIVRKSFYNDKLSIDNAIELGYNSIIDSQDTGDYIKSNRRLAICLKKHFKTFPLDNNLTPVKLSNGEHAIEYCLTGEHEVLTRSGWSRLDSLEKNIEILTWDKGILSWDTPYSYVEREYDGELIQIGGKFNVSCIGIPEHRVPLYNSRSGKFTTSTLGTLPSNSDQHILSAGWLSPDQGTSGDKDIMRLLVATQADGSFVKSSTGEHTGALSFGFTKERKINRLVELLDRLCLDYTVTEQASGVTYFYVPKNEVSDWLLEVMTTKKVFGWWMLQYNVEVLSSILDELKHWDGCVYDYGTVYSSKHEINVEVVQAIAAMCLKATTRQSQDVYRIIISSNPKHKVITCLKNKVVSHFTGKVYCPNVKSSYFMVRHEGKISITGNCFDFELGIEHPDIPGTSIRYKGLLDGLYEKTHLGKRVGTYVVDEKTCSSVFRVSGTQIVDVAKEEDKYKTEGQMIGYHWAARQLGLKPVGTLIYKIPLTKDFEPSFCLEIPINDYLVAIWSATLCNKIEELKDKYLFYKNSEHLPHYSFYPALTDSACVSYGRRCSFTDGCRYEGEDVMAMTHEQRVWDSTSKRDYTLKEYKQLKGIK